MSRLAGKVVVVTGAAQGQGAAVVEQLVADAAHVVALDLADAPQPTADSVTFQRHDIAEAGDWAALADRLRSEHGSIDALVNNAGVTWRARLADVEADDMQRVFAVNSTGAVLGMQALAPLMRPGASIVNVGSVAALTAHYPIAYTASKWAIRGISRVAALELGPRGIRVNLIHPGFIETPMTASAPPIFRDANIAQTPLGRTGEPAEVARLVAFLVSDESSFITGAEIPIDGGMSAHGGSKAISDAMFGEGVP